MKAVEGALVQQIVSAIKPKFLQALKNPVTKQITCIIPQIFTYLFDTYGDVTPVELNELKKKVEV